MVFSTLASGFYLFLVTCLVTCCCFLETSLAQDHSQASRTVRAVEGKERSREPILVPEGSLPPDVHFQAYQENAILTIAGQSYQLIKKIASGGYGIVYQALHLETQNMVAVKLSPMSVFAPTELSESELLGKVRVRPSDFSAFLKQIEEIKTSIATSDLKNRDQFHFFPKASDVLYLDGQFAGIDLLTGEQLSFAALIVPLASSTLKQESHQINANDYKMNPSEKASARVELAISVYNSLIPELTSLAEIGYGHFDIKPENIGFKENSGKFSVVDWEATRRLAAFKYNLLSFYEDSLFFTAPEEPNGRFELSRSVYSLGITLMTVLDKSFLTFLAVSPSNNFTVQDLESRISEVHRNLKDHQLKADLDELFRFIKASTIADIHQRREALAALKISEAFKKQLSKERSAAWLDGSLPKTEPIPKPSYVEPPRRKNPVKALIDRFRGALKSSTAIQCVDLFK